VSGSGRLPDFVVIGAMKSGTTSLYHWLGQHPSVRLSAVKDPQFFSREDRWERRLVPRVVRAHRTGLRAGEFSTSYTAPGCDDVAASLMAATMPRRGSST